MMTVDRKDEMGNVIEQKEYTKEELSTYNLYAINGCSQSVKEIQEPAFIGCYH